MTSATRTLSRPQAASRFAPALAALAFGLALFLDDGLRLAECDPQRDARHPPCPRPSLPLGRGLMFRRIVFSAFGAGFAVCLRDHRAAALHHRAADPPRRGIREGGGGGRIITPPWPNEATPAATHAHEHAQDAWEPADGFERTAFTALANLVMGIAASLILLSADGAEGRADRCPARASVGARRLCRRLAAALARPSA